MDGLGVVRRERAPRCLSFLVRIKAEAFKKNMSLSFVSISCAVCFGDPASLSSKALMAGILCLVGVVSFVLGGIAWTGFVWAKRAKKLEEQIS